jgi:hypothetical protein
MTAETVDSNHARRTEELRDATLVAQTFLAQYPSCFRLLGTEVVRTMVEGFVLRRVLASMYTGQFHGKTDVDTICRFVEDIFNEANRLSAPPRRNVLTCTLCGAVAPSPCACEVSR